MSVTEQVRVLKSTDKTNWSPVIGENFRAMLERNSKLSLEEKNTLTAQTSEILSSCVQPGDRKQATGLVIGYVQSGKTLSFTSLAAMARDNEFQLVIVLAGTTNNLVKQSYKRLNKDLAIDENREWKIFTTQDKKFQANEVQRVKATFDKWRRGKRSAPSVMIVAMKHWKHIENLADLMQHCNLEGISTLIIDDEGDQAGLNTKVHDQEESTTYSNIIKLRSIFPEHSYVLYTATPQAPLLISRIDFLSPDFGKVITPGSSYVGGKEFFVHNSPYIEQIPYSEVPDTDDPPTAPPDSLLKALRYFFIGVAEGMFTGDESSGNRSMMIHPDIRKDSHFMYSRWVKTIKADWKATVQKGQSHKERQYLLEQFRKEYDDLKKTNGVTATFSQIEELLLDAISDTVVQELNTRQTNKIQEPDWQEYSWILIGGIGLDRGFTVEGLTISYMPRSTGVGNVDNIQQRARFFGYKETYKGLCRIFLTSENIDAFTQYIDHEEGIRQSISGFLDEGKSLKEWRRSFFLEPGFQFTRSSVISLDLYSLSTKSGWIVPDFPFIDQKSCEQNRRTVEKIFTLDKFTEFRGNGWNDKQAIPKFSNAVSLDSVYECLAEISYGMPEDDLRHATLMMALDGVRAEHPNATCEIYGFAGSWSGSRAVRGLSDDTPPKIINLFQGANASTNYPGARNVKSDEKVTIQIHRYDLRNSLKEIVFPDVPVIAVFIPSQFKKTAHIESFDNWH